MRNIFTVSDEIIPFSNQAFISLKPSINRSPQQNKKKLLSLFLNVFRFPVQERRNLHHTLTLLLYFLI